MYHQRRALGSAKARRKMSGEMTGMEREEEVSKRGDDAAGCCWRRAAAAAQAGGVVRRRRRENGRDGDARGCAGKLVKCRGGALRTR
jgi:hypothetical protein